MALHGRVAELESGGEFSVAQPFGQHVKDFQLARSERRQIAVQRRGLSITGGEALHEPAGYRGGKQSVTRPHQPNRGDQVLGRDVFEQESTRAGPERGSAA